MFGAFYADFKPDCRLSLFFQPLFILRRLLFCLSVLFLGDFPGIQVSLFIYTSLFQVIYISKVKPFKESFMNTLEILNEFVVLAVSLMLPAFTDFIVLNNVI